MSIIIILIIGIISIFGIILWEEIQQTETSIEPESFKTVFSENSNTVNKNIETPAVKENVFDDIKDSNQNTSVDYSNIKVDKYFYNQLEDESKTIYKAFEANQENLKTGNYKIELGNSFSNLLKKEDGQEQLGKYYQSAFEAYNYDNPDVFYLDPNKMYLNIETTTSRNGNTYNVYINTGEQNNYFTDDFSSKEQVDIASQKIEKVKNNIIANKTGNTYDDIKMVHDYLVNNVEYDTSILQINIFFYFFIVFYQKFFTPHFPNNPNPLLFVLQIILFWAYLLQVQLFYLLLLLVSCYVPLYEYQLFEILYLIFFLLFPLFQLSTALSLL